MTAGAWPMFRRSAEGAESDERRTSNPHTPGEPVLGFIEDKYKYEYEFHNH